MKTSQLIKKLTALLEKHGDVEVMLNPTDGDGPYGTCGVSFEEVEDDDEYPEDYQMPKGFQFVEIR